MAKAVKKITWRQVALVVGAGFAWTKLGLGAAVKQVGVFRKEYPPKSEVGHMSQAAWQAKYGGSQSDYDDWLLGR